MTTPLLVKDAMHPRAVTLSPHSTLTDAVVTMQELRIKRLDRKSTRLNSSH